MPGRKIDRQSRFPFPGEDEPAPKASTTDRTTLGLRERVGMVCDGLYSAVSRWAANRAERRALARALDASLHGRVVFLERLATILLMIPSTGTVVFTYFGTAMPLAETGASILSKGEAVAFALTVGVLIWLAWAFIFSLVARLRSARLRAALLAGGLMVSVIATLDSPFAVLALVGDQAAQISLVDVARSYEAMRGTLGARAAAARTLLPALKVQADRFLKLRVQEEKSGTFSGKGKPGKVSATFGQIADLLGGLARELETGLSRIDAIQADVTATLGTMKGFAYREGPIRPRMEGVSAAADHIDADLDQAKQFDFTASIEATLASLDSSLLQPDATGDAFAQEQATQVAAIAAMAKPVAASLRAGLATLHRDGADTSPEVAVGRRPESPMAAIRTYWVALLPHWLAAVFIDLSPLGLLALLMAAQRQADDED